MSSGSITSDMATANADLDAVDAIIAGWVSSYALQAGASTSFNGSGFAKDGGNNAAGALIVRMQTTLRNLQAINHG
jgi:hypothetical protein